METLKEECEEMSLTWLDNLFPTKAIIITFKDLMLDLQIVPTKLSLFLIL